MKKWNFVFILLIALAFSLHAQISDVPEKIEITLLHTNDHHGHLEPFDIVGQKQVGGMAVRMALVREIREEAEKKGSSVLLFDCGDVNTGEPGSDMLMAEPDIKAMNLMGYHAMAVGNHEFDLPMEKLLKQQSWASFPYLAANVFYTKDDSHVFKPMVMFGIKGLKIAVFGITTPKTPSISTCGNNKDIRFANPREIIPQILEELKGKADLIIGLFHHDHEEVVALAKEFPGIDIILGGHTHLPTPSPIQVGKTLVVEAGSYGMMVGRLDLSFEGTRMVQSRYELIGLNLSQPLMDNDGKITCHPYAKKYEPDPEMKAFLKPYLDRTAKLLDEEIGETKEDTPKGLRGPFPQSSALGNLVADAMKEFAKVDVALQNIGGIRGDLLKGKITYRDVHRILPFANTLVVYTLSGKQLQEMIAEMAARDPSKGGIFEVSGLTLKVKNNQAVELKVEGKEIDPERTYKLATNSFIASGGDGYDIFKRLPHVDQGFYLSSIVVDYIRKHSPIVPDVTERMAWLK